jgi:hypothetical protein
MRKILIPLIAGVLAVGLAPSALAAGPRADTYWVVQCADGNTYEAVDAHAVDPGNKDLGGKSLAVYLFSQHTGLECWLVPGPVGP